MHLMFAGIAALIAAEAANAEDLPEKPWTLALTGGINAFDHEKARPFGNLLLSRDVGDLTLGIAGSVIDSGQRGIAGGSLASTTYQLSASAGYSFGALTVDGYAALGRRSFSTLNFVVPSGSSASLSSHGRTAGAGTTLTFDLPIGGNSFLSPFASLDYSQVDISRIAMTPAGTFARKQREKGVTGGFGGTFNHAYGKRAQHSFGIYAAALATSNDAASTAGGLGNSGSKRFLEGTGTGDYWLEGGPAASIALVETVHLNLAAVRTFGLKSGDGTTLSLTLRTNF